jgi:hypothetical protein
VRFMSSTQPRRRVAIIASLSMAIVLALQSPAFAQQTLTVLKAGTGTGTVTSSPAGINCGTDCSEIYADGTVVTLTATPDFGSYFVGWSGAGCGGTSTCTVTMTTSQTVTATFNSPSPKNVSLRVSDKVVDEGDRVRFKARVSPCAGHEGDQIQLKGGGRTRTKASTATCTAKWRLKMKRTSRFLAVSPQQDEDHLPGQSKRIRIRVIQEPEPRPDGGGGGGNCHPSYSVCIPPPPPDLDCADVNATNFQVTGSDPHGFDGDNDGIGCET